MAEHGPGYWTPDRKVTAAGLGGALATVVLGVLDANGVVVDFPGFQPAVATVVMYAVAYFVPESRRPPEVEGG